MNFPRCPECGKHLSSLADACPECDDSKSSPPSTLDLDLGERVVLRLASIPPGELVMAFRPPATFQKPFYMGVHQVTQEQYAVIMGENPSRFNGVNLPVERVSWDDAVEFSRKLSEKTGRNVRLPTEAEWEYACRAGTMTRFHFGDTINTDQANFNGGRHGKVGAGEYREKTTPVGSFPANAWGLHDMHGNVWEWCSIWNRYSYVRDVDLQNESTRILRGGSWNSDAFSCNSANNIRYVPSGRFSDFGFRIFLD